jgi:hypothetical protein
MECQMSISYDNRIVAFLDVLGFSALVRESVHVAAALQKVDRLMNLIHVVEKDNYEYIKLDEQNVSFFSDTIIISTSLSNSRVTPEDAAWTYCIREAGKLALEILGLGLPCRGSIVMGLCHHRRHLVVGPAIVEAYELEKRIANYPRIILNEGAMELLAKYINSQTPDWKTLVRDDRDGIHYLNIFHCAFGGSLPWTSYPPERSDFMKQIADSIGAGLNGSVGDPKTHGKYAWLQDEFRRSKDDQ